MDTQHLKFIPQSNVFKLLWVLFLSFLIGLEREGHHTQTGRYAFGGVRTYPMIGLVGYCIAFLTNGQSIALGMGFLAIAGLMALSYWHKLQTVENAGVTSEIACLATYLVGALVYFGHYWEAATLAITSLFLLELKSVLEKLATQFSSEDILTLTKFLLLTFVILPVLPNQAYGEFQLNPFKTWLVVIAVSGISYASYLLQRAFQGRGTLIIIALIGGAYSSTVTTVALAKQSTSDPLPRRYAGAILIASGMMYCRLIVLTGIFNKSLAALLWGPMSLVASIAILGGGIWLIFTGRSTKVYSVRGTSQNPLELRFALLFAGVFVMLLVLTHYAIEVLGQAGIYTLAGILGFADVDPFVMGITQSAGQSTALNISAIAILIAAASNSIAKGIYTLGIGDWKVGKSSLILQSILALLSLLPILYLR